MDYKDLKFEFRFLGYVKLPRQVEGYIKEIDLSFYRLKRNLEYEGKSLTPVCKTVKHTLLQDCVAFEKHIKERMADFEELGVPDETVEPTCKELLGKLERFHGRLLGFLQSLGLKPSYGVLTEYDSLVDILNFMMGLPISSKVEGFQGNHLE
jgi:hypothetical protein